jgi:hypothetical protein
LEVFLTFKIRKNIKPKKLDFDQFKTIETKEDSNKKINFVYEEVFNSRTLEYKQKKNNFSIEDKTSQNKKKDFYRKYIIIFSFKK